MPSLRRQNSNIAEHNPDEFEFDNRHRLFNQAMMQSKIMTLKDGIQLWMKCCDVTGAPYAETTVETQMTVIEEDFKNEIMQRVNRTLHEILRLEYVIAKDEETGTEMLVFANRAEEEVQEATQLNANDTSLFSGIESAIIGSRLGCISRIDAANAELPAGVRIASTTDCINHLIEEGWLVPCEEDLGYLRLTTHALTEIKPGIIDALKTQQQTQMQTQTQDGDSALDRALCPRCHDLVVYGHWCINCEQRLHTYCCPLQFSDAVQAECASCPTCSTESSVFNTFEAERRFESPSQEQQDQTTIGGAAGAGASEDPTGHDSEGPAQPDDMEE
eukprot:Clim_evm2s217 gene=Clim_evmTU2s217